jgi:hypothetical protein
MLKTKLLKVTQECLVYGKIVQDYLGPEITHIECINAECLIELPEPGKLPNLKSIVCINCPDLQIIPKYKKLRYIDLIFCAKLSGIPRFPRLRRIYITECFNLQELPNFSSFVKIYFDEDCDL